MKITEVTTTLLFIPHLGGHADATNVKPEAGNGTCFVHIKTDEGVEGLGIGRPAQPVRNYIEKVLKEQLIGRDPLDIERIWTDLFWKVRMGGRKGVAFCAISAIDIGLWDLKAKYLNLPLYKLLGPFTYEVPIYGSGGWTNLTIDQVVTELSGYVARGMTSVKMKIGKNFGACEKEDLERVATVRKELGDDIEILIDANNGYYAKQAIRMAKKFEEYNIGWLEEPVLADDIPGLAAVAKAVDVPIATGEHEYTKFGFKDIIVQGGADVVQPDVQRVGGVTEWMKVAAMAQAFNLPVAPHAAQVVHLHLCCATPNLRVVEYLGAAEQADKILYTEFPEPKNSMWAPDPNKPGLGLGLNPDAVKKYSI